LPVRGSLNLQHNFSTPSASSLPQGFLLLLPLAAITSVLDGSHDSNLKLLTIGILIDVGITKVREVTKARNFLVRCENVLCSDS
jgi:hypothetical protein